MRLKYNENVHGYWLDGDRCKGVTTLAKIPDNTFNLDKWRQRKLAVGLALRPDYVEVIAAHFDQDGTVDEYIEKAIEAAQASQGSNNGIAAHRVAQRRDTGETILETPLSAYVVKSWDEALDRAGLEIVPEYIEACVVYPSRKIAGRFDRYLRRKSDGRLVVADLKTGAKAIKFPHSMACQLGLYANAPLIARNIVPDSKGDFETEGFEEAPDVDKEVGYIFHIPIDAEPMVAEINISAGWEAVERIIFPTLQWRDSGNLIWPVATQVGGGESAPAPTVEQAPPAVDVGGGEPSSPPAAATPADPTRRQELIEHIKRLPDVEREELAHRWPVGVPTFKQSDAHTDEQLDAIAAMIDNVDWSPRKPDDPEPEPEPDLPPAARWVGPDEGASLDDETVEAIKATITTLDKVTLSQVNDWAAEAHAAHRPFSLSREDARTQRRFEIMRAAIALSPYEPDVQRAALGFVMGEEVQTSVTIGAALGSLTIGEASRLALLAESLGSTVSVVYGNGSVDFHGPGLAAVAA